MIDNKATVKLPLYDTTSVCGNYNIEVRGLLCDGTETIETLNWDRFGVGGNNTPSLDAIFSNLNCNVGQNCYLEIETSRAIGYSFEFFDTQGIKIGTTSGQVLNEKLYVNTNIFNFSSVYTQPGSYTVYMEGDLIGHCNSIEILETIIIDYE
jgi:hypothetical protein